MAGLKGELQDVIRKGRMPGVTPCRRMLNHGKTRNQPIKSDYIGTKPGTAPQSAD